MRFKDITARFHRQPPAKPITTPKPVEKQLAQFEPLLDEPNRIEKHKLTVRTRQADGETIRKSILKYIEEGKISLFYVSGNLNPKKEEGKRVREALEKDPEMSKFLQLTHEIDYYQGFGGLHRYAVPEFKDEKGNLNPNPGFYLARRVFVTWYGKDFETISSGWLTDSQENNHVFLSPNINKNEAGEETTDYSKYYLILNLVTPRTDGAGRQGLMWTAHLLCETSAAEDLYGMVSGSFDSFFSFFVNTIPGFREVEGTNPQKFLACLAEKKRNTGGEAHGGEFFKGELVLDMSKDTDHRLSFEPIEEKP